MQHTLCLTHGVVLWVCFFLQGQLHNVCWFYNAEVDFVECLDANQILLEGEITQNEDYHSYHDNH